MIEVENRKTSYHLPTRFHLMGILEATQIQHVQTKLIFVPLPKQISSSSYLPHLSLKSLIVKAKDLEVIADSSLLLFTTNHQVLTLK